MSTDADVLSIRVRMAGLQEFAFLALFQIGIESADEPKKDHNDET